MGRRYINLPMEKVISDYQSGMTLKALCEKYGVSQPTMRGRLISAGVRRSNINLPMEQVIYDYESGMTLIALGEKYGVSYRTIRDRLVSAGVQIRKYTLGKWVERISKKQGRNEKIAEMYQQGKTLQEVGNEFGLTGERVRQILNKIGVGTRDRLAKTDLDEAEMEELKVMLGEGLTLKKISERFGMQACVISDLIKAEGLTKTYVPRVSWDYKKAEEEYLSGVPLTEIARRHGLSSYNMIVYVMSNLGHPRRGEISVARNLPVTQIISEYESGLSFSYLGKKYGVSDMTIKRRLVKAGVQLRPRGSSIARLKKIELPVDQIWFDYESGMSIRKLAEKYGVSQKTIKRRLREAGV